MAIETDKVKAKYPNAVADCDNKGKWHIFTDEAHSEIVGVGDTEALAWENAAWRIDREAVLDELVAHDQEMNLYLFRERDYSSKDPSAAIPSVTLAEVTK